MHNHDHDLIAALAEGILAADLAASAEADVSTCADCSSELAGQRLALEALGSIGTTSLTSDESAALRAAVGGSLGLTAEPVPAASRRARRSPWPAIALAAGLAAVVMAVPVVGVMLTTGGGDASSDTVAAAVLEEREADLTADDAAEVEAGEMLGAAAGDPSNMTEPSPAEAPMAAEEAATTEAAITTTSIGLDGGAVTSPVAALEGEAALREFFDGGAAEQYFGYGEQTERSGLACNAQAEQEIGNAARFVDVTALLDDGRAGIIWVDGTWSLMVVFDAADCTVALVLP